MVQSEVTFRPGMTIGEACLQASSLLAGLGIGEPRSNANLLICHVLGFTKAELLRDWHEPMPEQLFETWATLIARKAAGEPVQYLIGEGWFYGRPFTVTPAVLIPRPETELLVEAVLEEADKLWPQTGEKAKVPTVVDVGVGSGAIAVTLSAERPGWRLFASDLSPDALAVARGNAARLEAAERITFVQGDLLLPFAVGGNSGEDQSGFASEQDTVEGAGDAVGVSNVISSSNAERAAESVAGLHIDVLVSNPPYIPAADIPGLQPEVRDYEPRLALVGGGDDGLEPYRRMAVQLPQLAQLPRIVGFELGIGQAQDVADLLRAIGHWDDIRIITDYGGIDRHVLAIRSGE
ncbi:release factor glutamine methyltransferase [Paenibacillus sp. CCS19]|uniref:N5-glutamine methyltransferase family protein n=1 Tax=Paenibacillus sp. CCS19 TaxID=3158387 RepID=UPI0025652A13|nr:HemK/PrmC family methyltransferase [Paenibacillus cellulosilyticus]GMK38178.1 release factor glutamine methyltransferase [Paenibacillus cellulosilyticus]